MEITVKHTTNDDILNIIDLRIDYFKEFYTEFSISDEKELRKNLINYFLKHLNKDCFVVLVIEDDKAVSSAIINIYTKAPNKRIPNADCSHI